MINNKKIIFIMCVVSAAVVQVFSIKCWDCRSHLDPKCADPFDNSSLPITDCDMVSPLRHLPTLKAIACRAIKQRVKNEVQYIRSCAFMVEDVEEGPDGKACIRIEKKNNISYEHCTCKQNACNA